jgi:putative transposase
MTEEMLIRAETIFQETLEKWGGELIKFNGQGDYVHLLIQTNPTVQLSKLVNNLKTVSSRLIRRDFREQIDQIYREPTLWRRSYFLMTTGRASIARLRQYIKEQGNEE